MGDLVISRPWRPAINTLNKATYITGESNLHCEEPAARHEQNTVILSVSTKDMSSCRHLHTHIPVTIYQNSRQVEKGKRQLMKWSLSPFDWMGWGKVSYDLIYMCLSIIQCKIVKSNCWGGMRSTNAPSIILWVDWLPGNVKVLPLYGQSRMDWAQCFLITLSKYDGCLSNCSRHSQ